MTRIRLITRADDLGSFSGVAPATLDAHRRGVIRNASLMVVAPYFREAAALVQGVPTLCLGLHLTICCEWRQQRWRPLAAPERIPTLVDAAGMLKSDPLRIHQDGVVLSEVLIECQAQLDHARACGLDIRYVDTHMCWEWIHAPSGPPTAAAVLAAFCRRNRVIWYHTRSTASLPPAAGSATTLRARLLAQVETAPPGTYLQFFHPSWSSAAILAEDLGTGPGSVARERCQEWEVISDPSLLHDLVHRGATCIRYDEA